MEAFADVKFGKYSAVLKLLEGVEDVVKQEFVSRFYTRVDFPCV